MDLPLENMTAGHLVTTTTAGKTTVIGVLEQCSSNCQYVILAMCGCLLLLAICYILVSLYTYREQHKKSVCWPCCFCHRHSQDHYVDYKPFIQRV